MRHPLSNPLTLKLLNWNYSPLVTIPVEEFPQNVRRGWGGDSLSPACGPALREGLPHRGPHVGEHAQVIDYEARRTKVFNSFNDFNHFNDFNCLSTPNGSPVFSSPATLATLQICNDAESLLSSWNCLNLQRQNTKL